MSKNIFIFILLFLFINVKKVSSDVSLTKITVYNPYLIKAILEVKCDYNRNTNDFVYHSFFDIKGNSNTTIIVPNTLKDCQIWPKIILW